MPKLTSKRVDAYMPKVKRVPPVLSEKKAKAVAKLESELEVIERCEDLASKQKNNFERKHNSVPGYQSDTVIGSDLTQHLLPRSQDKYHLTRWDFALRTVNRRAQRLRKLLKDKLKRHQ